MQTSTLLYFMTKMYFLLFLFQVLLQSFALLIGEALHQRHKTAAAAEQLHGNWELTSQTHDSSLKSVFKEVCECELFRVSVCSGTSFHTQKVYIRACSKEMKYHPGVTSWLQEANELISASVGIGLVFDGKDSRSTFTMVQGDIFGGTLYSCPCGWDFYQADGRSTTKVLVASVTVVS